jgi:hypothetical protein
MIEGIDFFVYLVSFPLNVKGNGLLALNDDGTYSVYINSKASVEAQKKAMRHEYRHMADDDMFGDKSITSIEKV